MKMTSCYLEPVESPSRLKALGTMQLKLPSSKILRLKDDYYIPNIVRNIIFVPMLLEHDFEIKEKGNNCSIYLSNEFYGNALIMIFYFCHLMIMFFMLIK